MVWKDWFALLKKVFFDCVPNGPLPRGAKKTCRMPRCISEYVSAIIHSDSTALRPWSFSFLRCS